MIEDYCKYDYNNIKITKEMNKPISFNISTLNDELKEKRNVKIYEELANDPNLLFPKIVNDYLEENKIELLKEFNEKDKFDIICAVSESGKKLELKCNHFDLGSVVIQNMKTMIRIKKSYDYLEKYKELLNSEIYLLNIIGNLKESKFETINGNSDEKYIKYSSKVDLVNEQKMISKFEYGLLIKIIELYVNKYRDNFNHIEITYTDESKLKGLEINATGEGNIIINYPELTEKLMEDGIIEELRTIVSDNRKKEKI